MSDVQSAQAAENASFADYTTLQVGGPAGHFHVASSRDEIIETAREVWATGDDWCVLGGGSNTLASDDGFAGHVIRIASTGITEERPGAGVVRMRVEAGENWDALVARSVDAGLAGIEALSGIPGSVGASPIQNIGAYGAELSDVLHSVEILDEDTNEVVELAASELGLGYRTSVFKRGRRAIVLSVTLDLEDKGGESAPVRYAQLAGALGVEIGASVPLADVRSRVLALRARKGMVLDDADPDTRSAGSFFTNPIVSADKAHDLPADAPRWPVEVEGVELVKLSAAWLIDNAGVRKGFGLPGSGAAISSKHTLALTNRDGATAADIAELARYVQERVSAEFGVLLQREPVQIGFPTDDDFADLT